MGGAQTGPQSNRLSAAEQHQRFEIDIRDQAGKPRDPARLPTGISFSTSGMVSTISTAPGESTSPDQVAV
ncbi:hypothetical protein T636_A1497 [Enterobacter hormaechei subsp. xiangfangensis]|nr:hypothetical protein [Enterobacter hormaechei]KHG49517.1 hypothetical protein T636_A1497 [Enterobacter hormaechei subsp. xiangfangensis]